MKEKYNDPNMAQAIAWWHKIGFLGRLKIFEVESRDDRDLLITNDVIKQWYFKYVPSAYTIVYLN